ncbi:5-methyltetrahydropteroyltriglutamate--homocysteine methyltransferase [Tanacetum coccineum]
MTRILWISLISIWAVQLILRLIKGWVSSPSKIHADKNVIRAISSTLDIRDTIKAFFAANAAALASRKSSPRVNNEAVQKAAALRGSDQRRATNVSARLDAQQNKLNLPIVPTTTIGSFPATIELRRSSPRVNNEAVQNLLSISRSKRLGNILDNILMKVSILVKENELITL